jgi:hypothetical protein
MVEPVFARIADGVVAQVIERVSPLPRSLETLLRSLHKTREVSVRILGTRQACTDAEHTFQPWLEGIYRTLQLRLRVCAFCGVVEVRDISLDILPGLTIGRGGARRRDDLLGWYSGKRHGGRTYL